MHLSETSREVLEKIKIAEQEGRFNDHLDPINYDNAIPMTDDYNYKYSLRDRIKYALIRFFVINPYSWFSNRHYLMTSVRGRENLKGIKRAIITCNHVNKLDALAVRKALRGHRLYVTVGDFNNQKGKLGDYMRATRTMPLSNRFSVMRNFDIKLSSLLEKKNYVLFFPEGSEWWEYELPRPFRSGAFHYAAKNMVPIIPVFITFLSSNRIGYDGIMQKKFVVNILPPIFPDEKLSLKENKDYLEKANWNAFVNKYENFYQEPIPSTFPPLTAIKAK